MNIINTNLISSFSSHTHIYCYKKIFIFNKKQITTKRRNSSAERIAKLFQKLAHTQIDVNPIRNVQTGNTDWRDGRSAK